MGYTETLTDNFNDNSFSTTTWATPNGVGTITETSAALHIPAKLTTPPYVRSSASYDLSKSIVGVKTLANTGTITSTCHLYIAADDAAGNEVNFSINPSNNVIAIGATGAATVSTSVITGSGTAFPAGTWLALGMIGNDNIVHCFKSTDNGVTWSEFARATIGGTFTKTAVHLKIAAVYTSSTESPTWQANIDEAAAWTRSFRQMIIDAFEGSSVNTSIWTTNGGSLISESGGKLSITSDPAYPLIIGPKNFDLTTGIFAVQIYQSGTAVSSSEVLFKVEDSAANAIQVNFQPGVANAWTIQTVGSATVSNAQYSTIGEFGTLWPDGQWLGLGYVGADNVISVFKSSDSITWTEIGCATIGGTFNKTAAGMTVANGFYDTTQHPTYVVTLDNASKFSLLPSVGGTAKVRVGGSWVTATPKVRVGGSWIVANPKRRVGGSWV
jgi:hypothetical protein